MTLSLPSPESITRVELHNGLTVLVRENHNSPAVVIGGYLWAGSINEAPEQAGLSSFSSAMLMRGTDTRSFAEINQTLEAVGAQLGVHSGVHSASFGGKALAEDLGLLLGVLADVLQNPTFPQEEVEKLRGQILTLLQRRAFDTRSMARLSFSAALFPNHPYGRSVQGYEETVATLRRDDLEGFYRSTFTPEGMVIAIVGAVSAPAVVESVAASLGQWHVAGVVPNRSIPPAVELDALRREDVPVDGKTQSDLILGWPGLARSDPDFMKAHLANVVLGVFGMMGRLGDSVRDEQGLAYYVYSRLEAGLGAGPWSTAAGVNPSNVEQTVDGILHEVRRLRDERVPAGELEDCQSFLTGSMPLRLETNEGVATTLLDMERHQLGLDYLQRYPGLVNAVSAGDIQEMTRRYLKPDLYTLAVAGPGA